MYIFIFLYNYSRSRKKIVTNNIISTKSLVRYSLYLTIQPGLRTTPKNNSFKLLRRTFIPTIRNYRYEELK